MSAPRRRIGRRPRRLPATTVRAELTTAAYVAGWRVVGALPAGLAAAAFRLGADAAARRGGRGVRQLRRNLGRVVGPAVAPAVLDELVRDALRSYARYWMETFRLPRMDTADVLARVVTEGVDHLDAAREAGHGVILALPHSGNWDVAGLWLLEHGFGFTTVAERLKPASLFDRFVAYRESLGMEILPLTGGERPVLEVLAERLRAGGCVCLIADRDLSAAGVPVDFFGQPATMPPGPALLAAMTGASLLPVTVYYTDDGWGQWIGPPIDLGSGRLRARIGRGVQALADSFAERIAAHPSDWHMLQKIWTADVAPAERRETAQSDAVGPAPGSAPMTAR